MATQARGQASDEGGEDRPVGPVQTRWRVRSAKHCNLMAQDQQLDILG